MTKAEKILCGKMHAIGNTVAVKPEGRQWLFLNPSSELTVERMEKLEELGIRIIGGRKEDWSCYTLYYADDYKQDGEVFVAKKDVVTSIPVVYLTGDVKSVRSHHVAPRVRARSIDLTNFCGVIAPQNITCDKLTIGNDVRFAGLLDVRVNASSYHEQLEAGRNYANCCTRSKVTNVVVVGDEPITSLESAFSHARDLRSVDLWNTNLKECRDFSWLCRGSLRLDRLRISEVNPNANFEDALTSTDLPDCYNAATLRSNDLMKIEAVKEKVPVLFPVMDELNFKVAITNLSEEAMEKVFPDYKCRVLLYQRAMDAFTFPYAFLFRRDVPITEELSQMLWREYPEIAEELLGMSRAEVFGFGESNIFSM